MSYSRSNFNKSYLPFGKESLHKKGKYSLKDRCFKLHQHIQNNLRSNNEPEVPNYRFAEFLQHHNNQLIKVCNENRKQRNEEKRFFNCFDGARTVINAEGIVSKNFISHRQTSSTLSSQNASQFGIIKQYRSLDKRGHFMHINPDNFIGEFPRKSLLNPERGESLHSDHKKQAAHYLYQSTKELGFNNQRNGIIYQNSEEKKKQKYSLRKEKQRPIQLATQNRKESLDYELLSGHLNIGNQLKSLGSPNTARLRNETHQLQNDYFEGQTSRNTRSDCQCQPRCHWINKWMNFIGKRYINHGPTLIDQKTLIQINKDIPRTQMTNKLFETVLYQNHLRDILTNYVKLNPFIGYVQGMNFIAATIISHTKDIGESSAIFNYLMREKGYEAIYEGNLTLGIQLARHLSQQLERYSNTLYNHFIQCDIEMQLFVRTWYFSMLGSFVPMDSMHLVIDKFMRKQFKGINQILLTMLIYLKQELMEDDSQDLILKLSNSWLAERAKKIDWEELIFSSENVMLRPISDRTASFS